MEPYSQIKSYKKLTNVERGKLISAGGELHNWLCNNKWTVLKTYTYGDTKQIQQVVFNNLYMYMCMYFSKNYNYRKGGHKFEGIEGT